jgi:peptide/nickel transport system permease protein
MSSASQAKAVFSWTDELEAIEQRNLWADAVERFVRNRMAVASLGGVVLLLLVSIFGPMISPWDYRDQDLLNVAQPPTAQHWFGTDLLGRDYLTRIMMGGRTAFLVAVLVTSTTTILGVSIGAASAYYGGRIDSTIMRATDVIMSFPHLLLAIFIVGTVRNPFVAWLNTTPVRGTELIDYFVVFGALSMVGWPGKARLVRGQVLSLMRREFIEAERAIGAPALLIIKDHLVPNAIGPVIVAISAQMGSVMLLESSLSFLGIGIMPPGASWGNMISENLVSWRYQPHLLAMPGIVLAIAVLGFNFLGDGVNDALNPRLSQRR